jgi:pimeloyl-ACP methyl ester carboxylesterase
MSAMFKQVLSVILLVLPVSVSQVSAQPDDPTERRYGVPPGGDLVLDLSGSWRVNTVTFLDEAMLQSDYDDSEWREVQVPARWSEQNITPTSSMPLVAIYRRVFETLDEWGDQEIGVATWLFPAHSTVSLNDVRLEPEGETPWFYADVTALLKPGGQNVLVVTTQFDGIYEMTLANPPRVGPLGEWELPSVEEIPVEFEIDGETVESTLYVLSGDEPRPGILMMGTGSHGLAFTEPFIPLARELAYNGYAVMPVAVEHQSTAAVEQAINELRALPVVDADHIGLIGAAESADAMLLHAPSPQPPQAIVTLSARQKDIPENLKVPVLLIATTQDALGPTNVYAERIAEQLAGPASVLVLPGSQSGLTILDGHWNPVRQAILDWFSSYLR